MVLFFIVDFGLLVSFYNNCLRQRLVAVGDFLFRQPGPDYNKGTKIFPMRKILLCNRSYHDKSWFSDNADH